MTTHQINRNQAITVLCDRCGHLRPGRFELGLCNHCIAEGIAATKNDRIMAHNASRDRWLPSGGSEKSHKWNV